MKILILNGSGKAYGNSRTFSQSFKNGAESKGHDVEVINIGSMKINGCVGCEGCHKLGKGCVQDDDMQKVYPSLEKAEMIVISSPVHYWGLSGQMQSLLTRLYAMEGMKPPRAKKYALILSSGSDNVYDAIVAQYRDLVKYFRAEDAGIKTFSGEGEQKTEQNLLEMYEFGASI